MNFSPRLDNTTQSNGSLAFLSFVLFIAISVGVTFWLMGLDGVQVVLDYLVSLGEKIGRVGSEPKWLIIYSLVCLFSQLLIVPSGSLILIAAGFVFSPLLAAGIFAITQILSTWPVFKMGIFLRSRFPGRFKAEGILAKLPDHLLKTVRSEGFMAAVTLRLTPVVPSAAACLLAVGLGIKLGVFLAATAVVCWIRPLFFASIGGSLQSLALLKSGDVKANSFLPLLAIFLTALLIFVTKLIIRYRSIKL